jgi:hypothetical protein
MKPFFFPTVYTQSRLHLLFGLHPFFKLFLFSNTLFYVLTLRALHLTFTMKLSSYLISAVLTATAIASPTSPPLDKRATTWCNNWDSLVTGRYTVFHNNWGAASGSGSQCTTFTSDVSNSVVWSTSWTWSGGPGQVKSYSNVALQSVNKKISDVKSIPSTWTWRYASLCSYMLLSIKCI